MHGRRILFGLITGALLAGCLTPIGNPPSSPVTRPLAGLRPPPPQVGGTAVYSVRNAYNSEPRGDVQYRVDKVEADRVFVAVTTTSPYAGLPHTEIYAAYGNWLRHPLVNHNQPVDYDFAAPFPAYLFPLDPGKTWSLRVNARNALTGKTHSVRVDGEVLGNERISVPAGAYDVVKIRRRVYAGDWDGFLEETRIVEIDWYAPELGRSVRLETNSSWLDTSRSAGGGGMLRSNQLMRGDWNVSELVSFQARVKGAAEAGKAASP